MKVKLASDKKNCYAFGFNFDENGECETTQKIAQSLLDTGVLVEVKTKRTTKKAQPDEE